VSFSQRQSGNLAAFFYVLLTQAIDIGHPIAYPSHRKEGYDGSLLPEVQNQEADEGQQGHHDEERQTRDARRLSNVWHQDV